MHTTLLDGTWSLTPADYKQVSLHTSYFDENPALPCTLPGDIHSTLLKADIIADPYWGTNELDMQWVGKLDWILSRSFTVSEEHLNDTRQIGRASCRERV